MPYEVSAGKSNVQDSHQCEIQADSEKNGRTQTYNAEEPDILNTYLDAMYEQTGDVAFMTVKINFFMGLRVGELVAQKWKDICEGNRIHIVCKEVRDQVANEITVADHTKTQTDHFCFIRKDFLHFSATRSFLIK